VKEYPTISPSKQYGVSVYGFDKLDGSNVRAEWDRKKGFWKFGKRHGLLDDSNPHLTLAESLIQDTYGSILGKIFKDERWTEATAFFEFWGSQSFAGSHVEGDDFRVTLFDVSVLKKGFLEPRAFLKLFKDVPHAGLLFQGNFNHEVEQEIREGRLEGMTFEGVVCKGACVSPGRPLMFKVKSQAWFDKLKDYCKGDEALFERLL
jgi:hypothetical protein